MQGFYDLVDIGVRCIVGRDEPGHGYAMFRYDDGCPLGYFIKKTR
jgi:hypothetical protein